MAIRVTLTAYNMGPECGEAEFDAWARWVTDHVNDVCDGIIEVGQFPFSGGPECDWLSGGTDDQRDAIRRWLAHEGWETFCTDPGAWPNRENRCSVMKHAEFYDSMRIGSSGTLIPPQRMPSGRPWTRGIRRRFSRT